MPTFESRRVVPVGMVKVTDVAPAGTVTLAGTTASVELLRNVTITPLAGAADDRLTVALAGVPPTTLVADNVIVASAGAGATAGLTVSVVDFCTPA